jgi:hypothetical protein
MLGVVGKLEKYIVHKSKNKIWKKDQKKIYLFIGAQTTNNHSLGHKEFGS